MHTVSTPDLSRIAQDLQIRKVQVEGVVALLDEGNTVPFIAYYRKDRTAGLPEEVIRQVQNRINQLRQLAERKQTILKSIEGQGKLTEELRATILAAESAKRVEDLYVPYRPKKRTPAAVAREQGLDGLAQAVWTRDPAVVNLAELLPTMVNPEKQLAAAADVLAGVQQLLAEQVSETAEVRAAVRAVVWDTGKLVTAKSEKLPEGKGLEYKDYFQFSEPLRQIPPHRILAINRGEKEGALKVHLEWNAEAAQRAALEKLPLADHPHAEMLQTVVQDALARLLSPALEREVRRDLTDRAEHHAVTIFARNLRSLLLQRPLQHCPVVAIDPGFRGGCKVAVLDEHGNVLEDAVIHPHQGTHRSGSKKNSATPPSAENSTVAPPPPAPADAPPPPAATDAVPPQAATDVVPPQAPTDAAPPQAPAAPPPPPQVQEKKEETALPPPQDRRKEARDKLEALIRKHQVRVIAIGNGPACRETEELIAGLIAELSGAPATSAAPVEQSAPALPNGAERTEQAAAPIDAAAPVVNHDGAAAAAPENGTPVAVAAAPPAEDPAPAQREPIPDLAYVIVNEAGAGAYSGSAVGREEFPSYDAALRSTISIGRRLQDPLNELVKVDPQNIGVGLYQHDVHPRHLKESLEAVIESSVNYVGVDLNTAGVPLLRHLSGLNQLIARDIVEHRKQHGPFKNREQLLQVPSMNPARYTQAAGFLKVTNGDTPLDRTWVHPESYPAAHQLLAELGFGPEVLEDAAKLPELRAKLQNISMEETAARLQLSVPSLTDLCGALGRPGFDPREDHPPPIFKKKLLKLEDLTPGMELKGTVLNVVDFGAFVDVGLKDSGLVHISQIANRFIKNPYDVLSVGDVVTVWVLTVDHERRRVSLTMVQPGTERKPPERNPAPARPPRGVRPPRGRRPAPAPQAPGANQPPAPASAEAAPTPIPVRVEAPKREGPRPVPTRPVPTRPVPVRKPARQPPRPKLSQAALQGEAPLRTFNELGAFFEAKKKDEPPPAS